MNFNSLKAFTKTKNGVDYNQIYVDFIAMIGYIDYMDKLIDYLRNSLQHERGAKALYRQIADTVSDLIVKDQAFTKGDKLPSAVSLAADLGITRLTAQRALQCLAGKKLVKSYKGKGTFVIAETIQYPKMLIHIKHIDHISFSNDSTIDLISSERCAEDAFPFPDISGLSDSYHRLVRVHSKQNVVYGYFELFLASDIYDLQPNMYERKLAVRAIIAAVGKDNVRDIRQTMIIEKAQNDIANHLKISAGDPVVKIFRTIYTKDNVAVYVGNIFYPGFLLNFECDWDL